MTERPDAWHQLGADVSGSDSAEEALRGGLLSGWNTRTVPMTAVLPPDEHGISRTVPVAERVAVVRDSPTGAQHIGIVSPSYKILPNEDQAPLLDVLAEESGATFGTAGPFPDGRRVFVNMQLPGHLTIGGEHITNHIATVNSHDGTTPFTIMVTPVHAATGTLLNVGACTFRLRHATGTAAVLYSEARSALDRVFNYLDWFQMTANELAGAPMSVAKFEGLVDRAHGPQAETARAAATRAKRRVADMAELFDGNTAWAGLCALAEWSDHLSPTRGDERESARATKAILDPGFKNRALALMQS